MRLWLSNRVAELGGRREEDTILLLIWMMGIKVINPRPADDYSGDVDGIMETKKRSAIHCSQKTSTATNKFAGRQDVTKVWTHRL
jgi:hypothetical protein